MGRSALGLALALYCAQACSDTQLDWSGELGTRLDYRLPSAERGWAQQKIKGKLGGRLDSDDWGQITAIGRGVQDFYYDQSRFEGSPAGDQARELWLHELYWQHGAEAWSWSLGKQQVTWGEADYFRVVDVVNAQDLRDYLLSYVEEFNQARQSLWMANLEYSGESWQQQWLWIWSMRPTRLPGAGSDFSSAALDAFQQLRAQLPDQRPGSAPEDHSLGWRAGRVLGDSTDLGLYAYYGWHPDPFIASDPWRERYHRRQMLGASLSTPLGAWVLRSDVALYLREALAQSDGQAGFADLWQGLLGLDYNAEDYSLSLQWREGQSVNEPAGMTGQQLRGASLYLEYRLAGDDLIVSNLTLQDLAQHSGMNELQVKYRLTDRWLLGVGSDWFWGQGSLLSGYQSQSRLFVRATWYL